MKYFSQFFSLVHILHILMQKCKKKQNENHFEQLSIHLINYIH